VQDPAQVAELLRRFDGTPRTTLAERQQPFIAFEDEPAEGPPGSDIAALMGPAPVHVDELIRQSGQGTGAVQMALLELEIAGRLVRHEGGRVSLTS